MFKYLIIAIVIAAIYFKNKESMATSFGTGFGNKKGLVKSGTFTDLKKNAQQVYMSAAQQRIDQEELDAVKIQGEDFKRLKKDFLSTEEGVENYCDRSCAHLNTFKANHERCMNECFSKRISISPY